MWLVRCSKIFASNEPSAGGTGESGQRLTELLGGDYDFERCESLADLDEGLLMQAPLRWFWDDWSIEEHQAWLNSHTDEERQAEIDARMAREDDWWNYRWERPW